MIMFQTLQYVTPSPFCALILKNLSSPGDVKMSEGRPGAGLLSIGININEGQLSLQSTQNASHQAQCSLLRFR